MIKIEFTGLDKTIKDINKIASDAKEKGNLAFDKFGNKTRNDAISNLNKNRTNDQGKLRGSISYNVAGLSVEVTVATAYAAYVEFGTKKYAAQYVAGLPAEWKSYAATFQGEGGGTFDQLILAIYDWLVRKKIRPNQKQFEQGDSFRGAGGSFTKQRKRKKVNKDRELQSLAYVIARKIARDGVRAQPFIYPAVTKNLPVLIKDIKKIFNG